MTNLWNDSRRDVEETRLKSDSTTLDVVLITLIVIIVVSRATTTTRIKITRWRATIETAAHELIQKSAQASEPKVGAAAHRRTLVLFPHPGLETSRGAVIRRLEAIDQQTPH